MRSVVELYVDGITGNGYSETAMRYVIYTGIESNCTWWRDVCAIGAEYKTFMF